MSIYIEGQPHGPRHADRLMGFARYRFFAALYRPKSIQQFAPGDHCHLNGLAVREGKIRYVTALGEINEAGGWRKNKRDGGILIDVQIG